MQSPACPRCNHHQLIKSGIVKGRQRYQCKQCHYFFTVFKAGKCIDPYYHQKALQLYLEGVSLREIERLLGISHVTVHHWVKKLQLPKPVKPSHRPNYKILSQDELLLFLQQPGALHQSGCLLTEMGDKFLFIQWKQPQTLPKKPGKP